MCGFHEDFEDEPSVEERYPDDQQFTDEEREEYERHLDETDDFGSEEYDAELNADRILEQQELEDFEQADEYFNHYDYNDDIGGESGW